MTVRELPMNVQVRLKTEQAALWHKRINTGYEVLAYNPTGTRYFHARRVVKSWSDTRGHYMPYGGGSHWLVRYGAVQFQSYKNPLGYKDYRLCDGRAFGKSKNGTEIPSKVSTKKEVLAIAKQIGIFHIK